MSVTITLPARARAQLVASGITVNRGGRPVLRDLDLTVSPGSRIGVVGDNGRGKTTLLQTLTGALRADAGEVRLTGTIGAADQEIPATGTVGDLIDQELSTVRSVLRTLEDSTAMLDNLATALEAAELLGAWDADRRVRVALEALGTVTDRTRPLAELSVGHRYRVRLACLLGAGHDFLLLDEPTNHLDASGLAFLTARLRAYPGGIVLVSHDRALLRDVTTTIMDLDPSRNSRPTVYGGGYAGYVTGRAAERRRWADEYERQQAEHQRLQRDLEQARGRLVTGWRPDKGTGRHKRATRAPGLVQAVHRRRDDLAAHAVTAPEPPLRFHLPQSPVESGKLLLDGDITLRTGDRLVITGRNGAGKSTLLRRIAAATNGILLPQESPAHGFTAQGSPAQGSPAPGKRRTAREIYGHQRVAPEDLGLLTAAEWDQPVETLSTGRRRRLDLALAVAGCPELLLLDEPTNHLSITLVDELTEALMTTSAAVVLATHDRRLLQDTIGWPHLHL